MTANGWFRCPPSGTENIFKIYAESYTSQPHLDAIVAEAREDVRRIQARGVSRPSRTESSKAPENTRHSWREN